MCWCAVKKLLTHSFCRVYCKKVFCFVIPLLCHSTCWMLHFNKILKHPNACCMCCAEIYKIVSQRQMREGGDDFHTPSSNVQTITVAPTDNSADRRRTCVSCNWCSPLQQDFLSIIVMCSAMIIYGKSGTGKTVCHSRHFVMASDYLYNLIWAFIVA